MNIFYLHTDPILAARSHCDKHVVKMILEYAQMLSTAHRVLQSDFAYKLYKPTHENHPSCRWVRHCRENYLWTYRCFRELCNIYTAATGKTHKTEQLRTWLSFPPRVLNFATYQPRAMFSDYNPVVTAVPQCMPDCYKVKQDATLAYQRYYIHEKSYMAKFTYNKEPVWFCRATGFSNNNVRTDWLTDVPDPLTTRPLNAPSRVTTPKRNASYARRNTPTSAPSSLSPLSPLSPFATSGRKPKLRPAANSLDQLTLLFGD